MSRLTCVPPCISVPLERIKTIVKQAAAKTVAAMFHICE